MEIKTLEQLTALDRTTLGQFVGNEAFVQWHQEQIACLELVAGVPKDVVTRFERCRKLFVYGLFCYDFFTVAADYASLTQETALRERIREKNPNVPPPVDKAKASSKRKGKKAPEGKWLDSQWATLTPLVKVALREGVLTGDIAVRLGLLICEPGKELADLILGPASDDEAESVKEARRAWESYQPAPAAYVLRNFAAHGTSDIMAVSIPCSLGAIQSVAALINHLWRPARAEE